MLGRTRVFASIVGVLALMFPLAASAMPVSEGVVIEGHSVPGVTIGDTRAEVESVWGSASFCQSITSGDFASCSWNTTDGQVTVRYAGADGGDADNSSQDVVSTVAFSGVPGWVTTAGVNTQLIIDDFDAAAAAYPGAQVSQGRFGGSIIHLESGVSLSWSTNPYSGFTTSRIGVFTPQAGDPEPEPEPDPIVVVTSNLDLTRTRRSVTATVTVVDGTGTGVADAFVTATWTQPRGSTVTVEATTDSNGQVEFSLRSRRSGTYSIEITSISGDGIQLDEAGSELAGSI